MATLNEILLQIAEQLHLNGNELIQYAAEDALGGYHINEEYRSWPMGSAWASELQILYALVRATKPESIVEIGGWVGASASHIASALRQNGSGHLTSVDNGIGGVGHGSGIPNDLRKFVTLVEANGEDWLAAQPDNNLDIVFEDADHSTALVKMLSGLGLEKLKPGGILVNHDAAHDFAIVGGGNKIYSDVGKAVRDGLEQAGARFRTYITEESDCGVAISQKPGEISRFQPDRYSVKVDAGQASEGFPGVTQSGRGEGQFYMQAMTGDHIIETTSDEIPPEISQSKPPVKKKPGRKPKAAK